MQIKRYSYIRLLVNPQENEAVKIAVSNLRQDLLRALDCRFLIPSGVPVLNIHIGTANICKGFDEQIDLSPLYGADGRLLWEGYLLCVKNSELFIVGSDRRGAIYGIYEFCETYLGVSPWHFFADVPIKPKSIVELPEGFIKADHPQVQYRGIFLNDEEELDHWAQRYFGEATMGVKTYERIFELLLRLKMNYLWPAMHVNSFNLIRENGALADRMGVVIGTSHCDMLMRSNNREWRPWLAKKRYTDVEYDYTIPGRNREILKEYWRESVEQNKDFEVSYTLGMRGIHDSGFGTKYLEGKEGRELLDAKIDLLSTVISDQEQMVNEVAGSDVQKNFVPYKEVLELYDNGLDVPDDLTLIWVDDNYGYVRRYPDERAKRQAAGNGIYYHNSYWAPPEGSYLFIGGIPLAHTRNELKKAYAEGIRKLWINNFGAMKPLEMQISFYADLAWEVGRAQLRTDDEAQWLKAWLDKTFPGGHCCSLAEDLLRLDQVINTRKVEQMDADAFPQSVACDEAAMRIHVLEGILNRTNAVYDQLPRAQKDAFFQLVLMKVHAAYYTYAMFYYADRSYLCCEQGKVCAAQQYVELANKHDKARRMLLDYYNHTLSSGKWNGMLTPEDYPPARCAMTPACTPPLEKGTAGAVITSACSMCFTHPDSTKAIEIAAVGPGGVRWRIELPEWLRCTDGAAAGETDTECRVLIEPAWDGKTWTAQTHRGQILVHACGADAVWQQKCIDVCCEIAHDMCLPGHPFTEEDGRVIIEAEGYLPESEPGEWHAIPHLGRFDGALMEAGKEAIGEGCLRYAVRVYSEGEHLLEIHRFPTLHSLGKLRFAVSLDGMPEKILESASNDEHRGTWRVNVRDGVDRLLMRLPHMERGVHILSIRALDPYLAFSRLVIYTQAGTSALGVRNGDIRLPMLCDPMEMAQTYYGAIELSPRPEVYLSAAHLEAEPLDAEDIVIPISGCAPAMSMQDLIRKAGEPFCERDGMIRIDVASALADNDNAFVRGKQWRHCTSSSWRSTGLALYIREPDLHWGVSDAPTLNYQIHTDAGVYHAWVRVFMWGDRTAHFTLGVDGEPIDEKELCGGRSLWRFDSELVWKWLPVADLNLSKGDHILTVYALASRIRFDRICLSRASKLPPHDDAWD